MSCPNKTLVVVEDNEGIRLQLGWVLTGYDVHFATDRPGALILLHQHHPEVVMLDLGLPPRRGTPDEGLRTLSDILCAAPATRVVVVSGHNQPEHLREARRRGAWAFLAKPASPEQLLKTIDAAYAVGRAAVATT